MCYLTETVSEDGKPVPSFVCLPKQQEEAPSGFVLSASYLWPRALLLFCSVEIPVHLDMCPLLPPVCSLALHLRCSLDCTLVLLAFRLYISRRFSTAPTSLPVG